MSNQLSIVNNFDEMNRLATAIARSGLFGITKPEEALCLMAIAHAEGYSPALAARDYHIIKGRPTLKADAMLSRFQQSGGKVKWNSYTDELVSGTFTHPQGGEITVDWDMERAKRAGLLGNPTWQKYPRNMLRARVVSEAVHTIFPGVAGAGIYTPEEAEDMDHQTPKEPKNVTPLAPQLPAQVDVVKEYMRSIKPQYVTNDAKLRELYDQFKLANFNNMEIEDMEKLISMRFEKEFGKKE